MNTANPSYNFNKAAEAAGIRKDQINVKAVGTLQDLEKRPMTMVEIRRAHGQHSRLSNLITWKFADFVGGEPPVYAISQYGRDYLAKLRRAGLIS